MMLAHRLGLPYPGYLWTVVRNTGMMWVLVQLSFVLLMPGPGPTLGIPAVLVWLDRRRSHELLLHANLGSSPFWFWAPSILLACVLDLIAIALFGSSGGSFGFALLG